MPVFRYTARSSRGDLVRGRLEGDSADGIAARLLGSGVTPIEVAAAGDGIESAGDLWRRLGGGQPKTVDLLLFSRQMYTITKSGLPLLRGMRALASSTHNAVLRDALHDVLESLESGRDLATALGRHGEIFSPLYVSLVRVGESTGTLERSFERLCQHLALDQDIHDRVSSALRYPLIVIAAIVVAVGVISVFVIPSFAPLFRSLGDDLPWATRVMLGSSQLVRDYWAALAALVAGTALAARRYVATESGRYRWHRAKLRLPVFGPLIHQAVLSRITRSLATALHAGLPMIQTLSVIARTAGNEYMAERVGQLRDAVERGESVSRAAATAGMFPPLVLQMIAVGEETGELVTLLEEVAGFYQREVEYSLRNLTAMLEPLLIVGVGIMVLILALGVFLPIWDTVARGSGLG